MGECGCRITYVRLRGDCIVRCPLHEAAPALLEALKDMLEHGGESSKEWIDMKYLRKAQAIVSKAEAVNG